MSPVGITPFENSHFNKNRHLLYSVFSTIKFINQLGGQFMFSLFSLSAPQNASSGPRAIDLQLLSDEEILKVWHQSQIIVNMLEEQDNSTHMALFYSQLIEQELQNRSQIKPSVFFNSARKQEINNAERATAPKNPSSFTSNMLATNILI